jgi:hypothetical protein
MSYLGVCAEVLKHPLRRVILSIVSCRSPQIYATADFSVMDELAALFFSQVRLS